MVSFTSRYEAKVVDKEGLVAYTPEENNVWHDLYTRQYPLAQQHACPSFLLGLEKLKLSAEAIPQLRTISETLTTFTGWSVEPVPALISHAKFFDLLAHRKFPAATFIRRREDFDYVTEPDMFHEIFGHCAMLCDPTFANFTADYAAFVLSQEEQYWPLLQRLYWFTVEFGLIQTPAGLRCYGGGIISSPQEIVYSTTSPRPLRLPFHLVDLLRTPYRIDILQPVYFVIDDYKQLYDCITPDLLDKVQEARRLKEFPPHFDLDPNNPTIHINFC